MNQESCSHCGENRSKMVACCGALWCGLCALMGHLGPHA